MYTPFLQFLFHKQRVALAHFVLNAAHDHWSRSILLADRGSRPLVACRGGRPFGWQAGTRQGKRANQILMRPAPKTNHAHVRKKRVRGHAAHRPSLEQVCAKFCARIKICSVPISFSKVLCCILPIKRMVLGRRKIDTCAGSKLLNKQE